MTEPGTPDVENLYARLGSGCAASVLRRAHGRRAPWATRRPGRVRPSAAVIDDGMLYGRGAADMKGGIACFRGGGARLPEGSGGLKRGSISFLITGDEEAIAINGTPKLLDWLKARGETHRCVRGRRAGEPQDVGDEIKIGRRGYMNAEIVVHGKQGHAAYPQNADNPVPKLARIIDRICAKPLDTGTEHFEPTSVQPTIISVPNTATNVIPAFGAGQLQHPLQRPAHAAPASRHGSAATARRRARSWAPRFTITLSGHGRRVPDQAGPAREHDGGGRRAP